MYAPGVLSEGKHVSFLPEIYLSIYLSIYGLRPHGGGLWMATQLKETETGKETEQHEWSQAISTVFRTARHRAPTISPPRSSKLELDPSHAAPP